MSNLYLAKSATGVVWDPPAEHHNLNVRLYDAGPRLSPKAVYNPGDEKIYVAWKSLSDDTTITYSQLDPKKPSMRATNIDTAQCKQSPSLVVFNGELLLLYKGTDAEIWCHTWNASKKVFDDAIPIKNIPRSSSYGLISATVVGAELHIIVNDYAAVRIHGFKGARKDGDFTELPSLYDMGSRPSGPVSAVSYQELLHVFYVSVGKPTLSCAKYDGKNWLGGFQVPLGPGEDWSKLAAGPDAFVYNGMLYLTYRREFDLWFHTYGGNGFSPRNSITCEGTGVERAVLIPASVSTPDDGIFTFYART